MASWIETSRELVVKTALFRLLSVGYRSRASGKEGKFDVLETKNWVNVIAVTPEGDTLLVRQFRYGSAEDSLEFPAGQIEPGEEPIEAARRELLEETGAEAQRWVELGSCRPNPALQNNTCFFFLAEAAEITRATAFDENEEIALERYRLDEIDGLIREKKLTHALAINCWHFYSSR